MMGVRVRGTMLMKVITKIDMQGCVCLSDRKRKTLAFLW